MHKHATKLTTPKSLRRYIVSRFGYLAIQKQITRALYQFAATKKTIVEEPSWRFCNEFFHGNKNFGLV